MQRMISHTEPLPNCRNGHRARHMHDVRRAEAGGGHLVDCACSTTGKHAEFDTALVEWCRANGHPVPHALLQAPLPLSNVTHLRARP